MTEPAIRSASAALLDERRRLTAGELADLAGVGDDAVPSLAALAHEVRLAWAGPTVEVEGILSAKTGGCGEDCHFCSQSAAFDTQVKATPFLDTDEVLAAARETAELGASEFCMVLAVRGPDRRTMDRLIELTALVSAATGLNVAVSAGILTREQAFELAAAGVHRYNHNLETSRSFFGRVVTTHSFDERVATCGYVREAGMELCCGVLLGMGETVEQRLELIEQIRAVEPCEVPVNFLNPRPGTPLQIRKPVAALEAIRWIALFPAGAAVGDPALRRGPGDHPARPPGHGHDRRHKRADSGQLPHHPGPLAARGPRHARRPADAHRQPLSRGLSKPGRWAGRGVERAEALSEPGRHCAGCGPRRLRRLPARTSTRPATAAVAAPGWPPRSPPPAGPPSAAAAPSVLSRRFATHSLRRAGHAQFVPDRESRESLVPLIHNSCTENS